MNRQNLNRTLVFGCLLMAFSGLARADITQCIDQAGTVTYTDVPCQNDEDVVQTSVVPKSSAISTKRSSSADRFSATEKTRATAAAKKSVSPRGLAVDVATMQAARSSMLLMDQASALSRQQKMASLDQEGSHWFSSTK